MNSKDPEIVKKMKDLFGDLKTPPKEVPEEELKRKYPGLYPRWKKDKTL